MFFVGIFQNVILYFLGKTGDRLVKMGDKQREQARFSPSAGWPACCLIVPVAAPTPATEAALRSLAEQDYPNYSLYLVTAFPDDSAAALVDLVRGQYANVAHVVAGSASGRGQKNHNLLAGVKEAGADCEIYAFCDSGHPAPPDFLRCLLGPIARGEAAFTTGYHEVEPGDQDIVTLAYTISVLFMRFMQGMPSLTQPWGGAMAVSRRAFEDYHVGRLWESNVVDDCSLGALLAREGAQIRLCPGAILKTYASSHAFTTWRAWLERQILFLKFCMKGEWLALSLVCLLMAAPPVWCAWVCLDGIFGVGSGTGPFLALCWLCVTGWTIGSWRRFVSSRPWIARWLWAFFCACFMFGGVYIGTFRSETLLWNNIIYRVGKGGRVESLERR